MISRRAMAEGMALLASAFGEEVDAARMEAYRVVLSPLLEDEAWLRAVRLACAREHYFPRPARLREYAQAGDVDRLRIEVARAYQAVLDCGTYTPNGTVWLFRTIEQRLGPAAAEAFVAAGGSGAFAMCSPSDEPFRLKRFVEAYTLAAQQGVERLLPGSRQRSALGPGRIETEVLTRLATQNEAGSCRSGGGR
jgi:hypothetical protein